MKSLMQLSHKYSCPEGGRGDKGTTHTYIDWYEKLFEPSRNKYINLLEIGIYEGHSIKMWEEYFTNKNTQIYGIDIDLSRIKFDFGINTFIIEADGTKPMELKAMDIIIEDGSHQVADQIKSFEIWKENLKEGGYYIIEDVELKGEMYNFWLNWCKNNKCSLIDMRAIGKTSDNALIIYKK
jgi:hypothetical protein